MFGQFEANVMLTRKVQTKFYSKIYNHCINSLRTGNRVYLFQSPDCGNSILCLVKLISLSDACWVDSRHCPVAFQKRGVHACVCIVLFQGLLCNRIVSVGFQDETNNLFLTSTLLGAKRFSVTNWLTKDRETNLCL